MERHLRNLIAGVALCAAAVAVAPESARAYDLSGIAIGADAGVASPSGLALSVGLGRLELDFILGLSLVLPSGGILLPGFSGAAGLFYTLADGDTTNFQIGGRLGTVVVTNTTAGIGGLELASFAALTLELDLRIEHRLDDHCAINLQVGVGAAIWPDSANPTGNDLVWGFGNTGLVGGAGFRYWFDGLGGGAPPPVTTSTTTQPVQATQPTTTTTTTTTTQDQGSSTPYWEQ
jgi:hypothetical protein